MAKIGMENRTIVPFSQVPDSMRWAVLSTEDRNFYSEPGFSVTGTLRAALSGISPAATPRAVGITQQYVKNAYLSSQQTITRKIKELAISVKLAREYSKDDILGFYLNTVYFGRGAYGIEAAAQTYFGVDSSKLTVAQSALLAGLLRAPSYYDPANNPQRGEGPLAARARQHGRHQAPDRRGRGGADLPGDPAGDRRQRARRDRARGADRHPGQAGARGRRHQRGRDQHQGPADHDDDRPGRAEGRRGAIAQAYANPTAKQANLQKALVAVDPSSGAVLAYYGGSDGTGFDYAQAYRQPGSSFKPYVLATALQQNLAGKTPAYTIQSVFDGSRRRRRSTGSRCRTTRPIRRPATTRSRRR